MTLKEMLKKSRSKRVVVACEVCEKYNHFFKKVMKGYKYFYTKDEWDKLADLEVVDTFTQELKGQHLFEKGLFTTKELVLVVDKEQALKVLGKERF